MQRLLFLCVVILSSAAAPSQEGRLVFKEQVIDPDAGVGYAVTVADINHDGKTDIVVVTENPDQVVWYENPSWTRRIIVEGFPKLPVCVQPLDVNNDGLLDLFVANYLKWDVNNEPVCEIDGAHDDPDVRPWPGDA